MAKIAVVFPGQGSQLVGMGQAFFDASAVAREIFAQAEAASGLPLARLCFEGPMDDLTRTVNLQPAVTAVNLACWAALVEAGARPDVVAGHSLGEYAALAAAGVISAQRCLELVSLRGRLMDRDAQANPGAMAAIMGATPQQAAELCAAVGGVVQPANYNTPQQTVITGAKDAVAAASAKAKEMGWKALPLKVSGAWHSPLMAQAAQDMAQAIADTAFAEPACPVIPNAGGAPTTVADELKGHLTAQLTAPVRWVQTVEAMLAMGVTVFIEAGPKNVLAGLINKTAPQGSVTVHNVQDPDGLRAALGAMQ